MKSASFLLLDAGEHLVQLGAEVGRDVDHARELRDDGPLQRLRARVLQQILLQRLGLGHEPLLALRDVLEPRAFQSLHHDPHEPSPSLSMRTMVPSVPTS